MLRNHFPVQSNKSRCTSCGGFTLIELLVVISIVTLLISILIPALQSARQAGQAVKCLSNLRQIMIANVSYAAENNDYLVQARMNNGVANPATYHTHYWFYKMVEVGSFTTASSLVCPSDSLPNDWSNKTPSRKYPIALNEHMPISYGYAITVGDGYWGDYRGNNGYSARRIGDFTGGIPSKTPSKAIVLSDFNNLPNQNADNSLIAIDNYKVLNDWRRGNTQMSARHAGGYDTHAPGQPQNGSGNFTFVDGHAQPLKAPFAIANNGAYAPFTDYWNWAGYDW